MPKFKCCGCKDRFDGESMISLPGGGFCTIDCSISYARAKQEKARAKQMTKAKRDKRESDKTARSKRRADLKRVRRNPRNEALKTAQLLGRISAADDNGYCACITCGHTGKWNEGFDGGHFIAKGNCSYWSLDPRNINPQCKECNSFRMKHDTAPIAYTLWMVDKYGREFVDHMKEMRHTLVKRSVSDYDSFISEASKEILFHKKRVGAS